MPTPIPCFSVVNAVGSLIARTTKCGVYLNAGRYVSLVYFMSSFTCILCREMAVASTKAFVTQVTVLGLIGIIFTSSFSKFPKKN